MKPSSPDEARTEFATERTVLAAERTYAAWIRTGLTSLAAGLGTEKLMVDLMPGWSIRIVAVVLILFSSFSFGLAAWRYAGLEEALRQVETPILHPRVLWLSSSFLVMISPFSLLSLWLV